MKLLKIWLAVGVAGSKSSRHNIRQSVRAALGAIFNSENFLQNFYIR